MGDAADDLFDAALQERAMKEDFQALDLRPCDICQGEGYELGDDGNPEECHLCEGAGFFDVDGFPVDPADVL